MWLANGTWPYGACQEQGKGTRSDRPIQLLLIGASAVSTRSCADLPTATW